MIDPNILKENPEILLDNVKRRNLDISLDELNILDKARRKTRFDADEARAKQKKLSKEIAGLEGEEKEKILEEAGVLSDKVKDLVSVADSSEKKFLDLWIKIPNLVDPSSPEGAQTKTTMN